MANGSGCLIHSDGDIYEGEWLNDRNQITATVTIITSKMALISKAHGSKTLSLAPATKSGTTKPLTPANITMTRSRVRALSAGPTALSTRVTSKITTYTGKAHINGATEETMMAYGTSI